MTDAAMQQVNEPQAKLPRDQKRDATVRVGRDKEPHPHTFVHLSQLQALRPGSHSTLIWGSYSGLHIVQRHIVQPLL